MLQNVSDIRSCYGCGVCAVACAKGIISIELDKNGFYAPIISDLSKCTSCTMCVSVCSFCDDKISPVTEDIKGFAAFIKNLETREKCSSGGVGYDIGEHLLTQGYKICGVRYNSSVDRAEHYLSATIDDLRETRGSKYIQSYTVDAFKQINWKEKYLVTGTPCQIDSIRRLIRKRKVEHNFILLDFFCHGVPSKFVWTKYTEGIKKHTGPIISASWRSKENGWHDSYKMTVIGQRGAYSRCFSQGDDFFRSFLSDSCLGRACYEKCKYKHLASAADVRIGDFWGREFQNEQEGVSALVSFTSKGKDVVDQLLRSQINPCDLRVTTEGQMKKSSKMPYHYELNLLMLRSKLSLKNFLRIERFISRVSGRLGRVWKILYREQV